MTSCHIIYTNPHIRPRIDNLTTLHHHHLLIRRLSCHTLHCSGHAWNRTCQKISVNLRVNHRHIPRLPLPVLRNNSRKSPWTMSLRRQVKGKGVTLRTVQEIESVQNWSQRLIKNLNKKLTWNKSRTWSATRLHLHMTIAAWTVSTVMKTCSWASQIVHFSTKMKTVFKNNQKICLAKVFPQVFS